MASTVTFALTFPESTISTPLQERLSNSVSPQGLERKNAVSRWSMAELVGILTLVNVGLYVAAVQAVSHWMVVLPTTTVVTCGIILMFTGTTVLGIWLSGYPLSFFGFRAAKIGYLVWDALLWTSLFGGVLVAIKALAIWSGVLQDQALFSGLAFTLGNERLLWSDLVLYGVFTALQEFVARGGTQSSLYAIFTGRHQRWLAMAAPALLFAGFHLHLSLTYAVLVLIPGLFWGWLYDRQRSLLGVCLSHLLLGLWALYGLGLPGLA